MHCRNETASNTIQLTIDESNFFFFGVDSVAFVFLYDDGNDALHANNEKIIYAGIQKLNRNNEMIRLYIYMWSWVCGVCHSLSYRIYRCRAILIGPSFRLTAANVVNNFANASKQTVNRRRVGLTHTHELKRFYFSTFSSTNAGVVYRVLCSVHNIIIHPFTNRTHFMRRQLYSMYFYFLLRRSLSVERSIV